MKIIDEMTFFLFILIHKITSTSSKEKDGECRFLLKKFLKKSLPTTACLSLYFGKTCLNFKNPIPFLVALAALARE